MPDVQLPVSSLPKDLPDVYVIFFCTYDPLGPGLPVYTMEMRLPKKRTRRSRTEEDMCS